ncbi:MAG: hypothetical protein HGA90_02010, partial [Alphaproteobacteria bacterium]|nr:hypothetical protein [Alphaproteobacteria bacterium]
MTATPKIARALISVSDKNGLVEMAKKLVEMEVAILSTGGSAEKLRQANIPVVDVGAYTGFPEMMEGRVKTLHPKVHGGILQRRDNAEDQAAAAEHDIPAIDLVIVNLYPFRESFYERLGYVAFPLAKIAKFAPQSLTPLLNMQTGGEIDLQLL